MAKTNVEQLIRRYNYMDSERSVWETIWQDILDYVVPNREPILDEYRGAEGEDRSIDIYDSLPSEALRNLGAALNSMLTNQYSDWFELETEDEELNEDNAVKEWLDVVKDVIVKSLDNSNFYPEAHEFYLDLGSIGTGIIYCEEDTRIDKDIRFSTRHIREIYTAENKYGEVDTVFRKTIYTIRQAAQRWGLKKLSARAQKDFKETPDADLDFLHCVYPREDYDGRRRDKLNKPYASVWIELDQRKIVDEGGYDYFPYVVARWLKSSGERYGRSPAMSVLGDIKTLNDMWKTTLGAAQKAIDPPMKASPDVKDADLTPGAINPIDPTTEGFLDPLYQVNLSAFPITFQMIQQKQDSIANAFMSSQLNIIDQKKMTAEEVRARMSENMKALGPTFGRLQTEFLEKVISTVYEMLLKQTNMDGTPKIPPMPMASGQGLKVKYVSPLARAQKSSDLQAISGTVGFASNFVEIKPDVMDNIDIDQAVRKVADYQGVPMEIMRSEREVMQIRQQRQRMIQQQQQMQMQQQQLAAAKDGAKAMKDATEAEANAEV